MEFTKLSPGHEDGIQDIAFDYYGKRCATCSTDKHIKVWTLEDDSSLNGNGTQAGKPSWACADIPRAHNDSIWRLSWAHPEFGQLIASCSNDNTVCIWEEQELVTFQQQSKATTSSDSSASAANSAPQASWLKKATLADSKKSVNDVKFAPHNQGLKIAAASADGIVRIYEASDIFSLTYWQIQDSLRVEYVLDGPDASADAAAEHLGLMCISWNDSPFEHPRLAIGGYSKRAVVWAQQPGGKWAEECVLGTHTNAIQDIAWAPNMGRTYHLIATASRENTFQIHTLLKQQADEALVYQSSERVASPNGSVIWRVAWNATGTVLATSSEDGTMCLWRRGFDGKWINIKAVEHDSTHLR